MSGSAGTFPPDGASTSLDDLVAAYLQQLDDGRDVDPARFVEPWPQHQVEFLEFAARHSGLDRMTTRPVTDAAQMPWRETSEERNGLEAEFQMGGLLGRGGMGTVWAATRRSDQQRVAIKILNASVATVDDNRIRFLREARAIQSLDHHHIVPCLDVGHASGSPYLVMKLIDGVTLSDVVAEQMRSGSNRSTVALADSNSKEPHSDANSRVSECLAQAQRSNTYFHTIAQLIADVAAAVKAAHEQAIVHRDIKPSNLMLDCIGKVWLTDFGLASIGDAQTLLTHTGDILGTPAFMSPEQASGNRDVVDHRTDIYALGATLYTLAALQRPYTGSSHKVLRDVSEGILTPPSKHRADIPRDVEAIILKAMARDPAKRYQSCASLETELRRFVEGHRVRARLPGPANRFVQWLARNPRTTLTATLGLLFTVVSVITIQSVVSQRLSGVNAKLQTSNDKLEATNSELTTANDRLIESRDQMRHMVYVSDVSAAYRAYWNQDTDTARRILARHNPNGDESDQRGMEWHLLDRLSQPADIASVSAHDGAATEVAMIPGTNEFLTSGADGRVIRWQLHADSIDEPSIKQVAEFRIQGDINALAVSPDGKSFVVGLVGALETNLASLHDALTGDLIRSLAWHTTTIESAAFSPDGTKVATASRYRNVLVHSLEGQLLHSFPADSRNINVVFTSDGQAICGIGEFVDDKSHRYSALQRWELAKDNSPQRLPTRFSPLVFATSSEDGRILAAGYDDVALFDSGTEKPIATQSDLRGRVRVVAVSPNARHMAAGCDNGLLHLWINVDVKATSGELPVPLTVDCGNAGITAVNFMDGDSLPIKPPAPGASNLPVALITCTDGSVKAVQARGQDAFVRSPIRFFNTATASSDSETLFAWSRNDRIYRFDEVVSQTVKPVEVAKFKHDDVGSMAVSRDQSLMALSCPQVISIVNPATGDLVQSLPKPDPNATTNAMAFTSDGSSLYVLFHDRLMQYATTDWSLQQEWTGFDEAMERFSIHPQDGTVLVTLPTALLKLNPADGTLSPVHELSVSSSGAVEIRHSASGRLIAIGYVDGTIELLDAVALRRVAILRGHRYDIHTLDFVNNDRTLISSSNDESIRFWDVATGRQLGELKDVATRCHVLPAHDCVLTYTSGRPLKLWTGHAKR